MNDFISDKGPLAGLRVLDFSQMLSGPFATQQLGDLGAEILKVEAPAVGDDSRHYTTTSLAGECAFYLSTNRNKRSIELDLKNPAGLAIAQELAAHVDVVVENFSNGVAERLGVGYERLNAANPRLVYCSISGYGRDDPSEIPRRAYDGMVQACSGFMSLTGYADRPPIRSSIPMLDVATALTATSAILAGLRARDEHGAGQHIEVALLDVAISVLTLFGMSTLITGKDLQRNGNRAPQTAPSDVYETSDGLVFVTCGNNRLFQRLTTEALGRPELAEDPAFASNADRVANVERLTELLNDSFRQRPRDHWVKSLNAVGVPAAPILTMSEAFASEDVQRREIIQHLPHPTAGQVPTVRSPIVMTKTPVVPPFAPPLLGQDTSSVIAEVLGWSHEKISAAEDDGAFGKRP